MFFTYMETNIPGDMCSPTCETYITSDMFFLARETHITNDMYTRAGEHILETIYMQRVNVIKWPLHIIA